MLSRIIFICAMLTSGALPVLALGDDAPSWLLQAATIKTPAYDKDVQAVVLLDEGRTTVSDDGKVTKVATFAVRILSREGRQYARAAISYRTDTGKVRDMHAWLIRASGEIKKYGKDQTLDYAFDNDVYNESRTKAILAVDDADAGTVFGYETIIEERPFFDQDMWYFQGHIIPVISSRYSLTLPTNWRASGVTFNNSKIEPAISGTTFVWEMHNLPPLKEEPASPELTTIAPSLAVSYFPTEDSARRNSSRTFDNWTEVSRWYTSLSDQQSEPTEALVAKAKQLTAGSKTELDRIRAIARFAQDIQYISIQIGIGGYRPHSAAEVFSKSYGDCKDKANLMRAMLKTINIPSYLVLIVSGDPTFVREEWASPSWFNHCIIAVKVSDETQAASVVMHPTLGRLLIFDSTDDITPVGDLPDHEQGSFALIAAGDAGVLLRMPTTPPEANSLDRQSDVVLDADGSITATVRERTKGQTAADERRMFRGRSRPEYTDLIEKWIARSANGAKLTKVEPVDSSVEGRFALNIDFNARGYGQLMQDRLLVFRPAILEREGSLVLTDAKRLYPIVLQAEAYTETVSVKLPAGFVVDEVPDAMKLDSSFGTFSTKYEVKDGNLIFSRSLIQRAVTIPVEDYVKVKNFFAGMRAAEQARVVLVRN